MAQVFCIGEGDIDDRFCFAPFCFNNPLFGRPLDVAEVILLWGTESVTRYNTSLIHLMLLC